MYIYYIYIYIYILGALYDCLFIYHRNFIHFLNYFFSFPSRILFASFKLNNKFPIIRLKLSGNAFRSSLNIFMPKKLKCRAALGSCFS